MENKFPIKDFIKAKRILYTLSILLIFILITLATGVVHVKKRVNEMFRFNKERQEQNYYLAEFEFKMLGIGYLIDKGDYFEGIGLLNRLYKRLKTGNGLIKVPHFKNINEEIDFYLNLQNPVTGAFMDADYPLCSYHGPTENVLLHLEKLFMEADRPFKLKYPLKYLDRINSPEKLVNYLNDISTIGLLTSRFPQTTFHNARDILNLSWSEKNYHCSGYDLVITRHRLYTFSEEWKHTLLKWFYENQDPKTGLWGPKSTSGRLLKKDLNNTASILKSFRDNKGNDIHSEFPLRYKEKLFNSALNVLSEKVPSDRKKFSAWHEWYLKTAKAMRMLTRNLWKDGKNENKKRAGEVIKNYISVLYENFYIVEKGAFSFYPDGKEPTLDGAQKYFVLTRDIGAFSKKKRKLLWGENELKSTILSKPDSSILIELAKEYDLNSFRFFKQEPDKEFFKKAFLVFYPKEPGVLDAVDISMKLEEWIDKTPQTMGNWSSRADLKKRIIKVPHIKVCCCKVPEKILEEEDITIVGFNTLQIPVLKIRLKHLQDLSD